MSDWGVIQNCLHLKETDLNFQVTGEQMTSTFLTNVVGPLMLTKVRLLYQHLADN